MTGSDQEVTSFNRKSPGSGCRGPISQVLGKFQLKEIVNWKEVEQKQNQLMFLENRYRSL